MRVLCGSSVRERPTVLQAHLRALQAQVLPPDVEIDFAFVDDNTDPTSSALLEPFRRLPCEPTDQAATYDGDSETTHEWNVPAFYRLARQKQRLCDLARSEGYDYLWLVDSDLICDPRTLWSLYHADKPIVSGVFWTSWQPDSPMLPQVWLQHPYGLAGGRTKTSNAFLSSLVDRQLVQVAGLGACTLIKTEALVDCRFDPPLPDLPEGGMWQGEDRHFCVRANRAHWELWADGWPDIAHIYRPSYDEHIESIEKSLSEDLQRPAIGHYVNFTIEELQTPSLAGHALHVRGRLGSLRILPEIETDLLDMRVGQSIITKITYPDWYEMTELAGQSRFLQLTLIGVKRYTTPIGLPEVQSSAYGRYFTPGQLQTINAARVERTDGDAQQDSDAVDIGPAQ